MIRRFFLLILITTVTAGVSIAQNAPKADGDKKLGSVYSLAFGGSGGYLGVELKEVSNSNYQDFGLGSVRGVAVTHVMKDTPAEKAGIQANDIIVRFNGDEITSTRKLTRLISEVAPDHTVTLTIARNGGEMEIPVTMGERKGTMFVGRDFEFPAPPMPPMPPSAPNAPPRPMLPPLAPDVPVFPDGDMAVFSLFTRNTIGVRVAPLTKQLGEFFGVTDGKGVFITDVAKDSPAERSGLKAGDVILEIDGKAVKSQLDLMRAGGDKLEPLILTIVRNRVRQTISVTPEAFKDGPARIDGFEFRTRQRETN